MLARIPLYLKAALVGLFALALSSCGARHAGKIYDLTDREALARCENVTIVRVHNQGNQDVAIYWVRDRSAGFGADPRFTRREMRRASVLGPRIFQVTSHTSDQLALCDPRPRSAVFFLDPLAVRRGWVLDLYAPVDERTDLVELWVARHLPNSGGQVR